MSVTWTRIDARELATTGGVYRIFSGDQCLYVGQSRHHPLGRLLSHLSQQPWWHEVTHVDYSLIPNDRPARGRSRLSALEAALIRDLRPKYNSTGNEARQRAPGGDEQDVPVRSLCMTADGVLWRLQGIGGLSDNEKADVAAALRKVVLS